MSLIHRTSSTESFSRRLSQAGPATNGSRQSEPQAALEQQLDLGSKGRRLSFSPVATGPSSDLPVAAFEVPRRKRIAQVGVAVIYCLLGAGIVFGFAALKPVLVAEGVYHDLCTEQELKDGVDFCYKQELRLNFMFTLAAVSTNIAALPIGTILDRFGPRVASLIGACFISLGCLFLAFAADVPFDAYIPGYFFLALGGPFIFIPSFQLSNTFPKRSGLILALLTGAFDSSSSIFLFYRLIYQNTNGALKPRWFFLAYLIVPVYIIIAQIFLMPSVSYKTVGELLADDPSASADPGPTRRVSDATTALLGTDKAQREAERERASGVFGALHGLPAHRQLLTPWFVLIAIFTAVQMTRINFFVATIRSQYTDLLSPELAAAVNSAFDVALPLGGLVAIPFVGAILDHTRTVTVLAALVAVATVIGALGLIRDMPWAAYANVVLFCLYRPFYYTAVSDYAAKVFGFDTFGKVYGLVICLAGIANFSQSGLDALLHGICNGDPTPVNAALLALGLLTGAVLVVYVAWMSDKVLRERLEVEAEASVGTERERLLPGGGEWEGTLAEHEGEDASGVPARASSATKNNEPQSGSGGA